MQFFERFVMFSSANEVNLSLLIQEFKSFLFLRITRLYAFFGAYFLQVVWFFTFLTS